MDVRERHQCVWFSSPSTNEISSLSVLDLSNYVFVAISSSPCFSVCLIVLLAWSIVYNAQLSHPHGPLAFQAHRPFPMMLCSSGLLFPFGALHALGLVRCFVQWKRTGTFTPCGWLATRPGLPWKCHCPSHTHSDRLVQALRGHRRRLFKGLWPYGPWSCDENIPQDWSLPSTPQLLGRWGNCQGLELVWRAGRIWYRSRWEQAEHQLEGRDFEDHIF